VVDEQQAAALADDRRWVEVLRCPACGGALDLHAVPTPALGRGLWGTLTCGCTTYPVVDDIPVLLPDGAHVFTTGVDQVLFEGVAVGDLVDMVRGEDPVAALEALLATPPVPWPLGRIGAVERAVTTGPLASAARRAGERRVRRLLGRRDELTVEELLAVRYLHSLEIGHNYAYFLMRPSQPRQLSFLSVLEVLPPGLVLDIGCGLGHHSWSMGLTGHPVIGVDYNYWELWMARWWLAPTQRFACADVTRPLPFPDGLGDVSWFADTIDFVPDPAATAAEMRRCTAPGGPVVLAAISTAHRGPIYPTGRPLEDWRAEFAHLGPLRVLDQQLLIEGYLDGWLPDLSADHPAEALDSAHGVFVIAGGDASFLRDHGPLPDPPPHARGRLVVNPIYAPVGGDLRRVRLQMPSDWFAFEDAALTRYHDHQALLTDEEVADLRRGELTPRLRRLVDRFVVVGVPERYIRRQRRRLKLRVYQITTALAPRTVDIPDDAARLTGRRPLGWRSPARRPAPGDRWVP
jgi:SAM-dependent methyltransferase/uncharacterized protein YbaR (Trm112 family)